jgi:hypothetical protein
MVKRNKPLMGTKLVPSIENIEGCYKWGGKWDHKKKFCYKEDRKGGCTAPYNGTEYCWSVFSYDSIVYDPHNNERHVRLFRPEVYGKIVGDWDNPFYDPYSGYYEDNPWELEQATHKDAIDMAKQDALAGFVIFRGGPCFNTRGRRMSCDEPNAVACPNPDIIIDYYNRDKSLTGEDKPWLGYEPKNKRNELFDKPQPGKNWGDHSLSDYGLIIKNNNKQLDEDDEE